MRIAFDGNKAANNKAGLGNYSRFVIRMIAEKYPDCQIDIYVGKSKFPELVQPLAQLPNVEVITPRTAFMKAFHGLWQRFYVPRELKKRHTDVYHGLCNVLPVPKVKGVKTVVTVHDLIFLILPHTYGWLDRHIFNHKFKQACRKADKIVAVSRCTAADLSKFYWVPKDEIIVAYQGCDSSFRKKCTEQFKKAAALRFNLPHRYLLSVGTIEERKNTALIVKALERFPDLELVLVGRRTKYTDSVEATAIQNGTADRLHILEGVSPKELPAIYQLAEIFIYPSEYEGFGIPILEGLCSGVPVIAATGSCLEEAGGDAALYVDPDDVDGLAEAIGKILSDEELRSRMVERGYAHAAGFSDEALADHLMSIYTGAL